MQTVKLAGGKLTLKAPGNWKQVKPKVRIIECEFLIPAAKGDERDGRMTIMIAGGSIQANLDRWIGQFKQPADGIVRENAKIEKKQIAGLTVHTVRVTGAFQDRPNGPFGAAVEREDYMMLAAILEMKNAGNYFIKFYGPQRTIADQSTSFQKMLESLKKE